MEGLSNYVKKNFKNIMFLLVFAFIAFVYVSEANKAEIQVKTYNEFIELVETGQVEEVNISISNDTFFFETVDGEEFETDNPRKDGFKEYLLTKDVAVIETEETFTYKLLGFFASNWSVFIMVGLMSIVVLSLKNGPNSAKSYLVGKETTNIKLEEVILPENVKRDIIRNVDFLKNPKKYQDAGATMPKGMLLVGPPGTGKTMIAKAIANEAGVPFFYASGADFIELYVGQGAKRIRALFEEARLNAPCVVFIDEIDAIGGVRGKKNNSENDQTINALLTSLDGFNSKTGILTIAATNRVDVLDPGLTREGRFDQHIQIPLPSKSHRKVMIENLMANINLECTFNLDSLARKTAGFSGATLKALMNESVLIAIDNGSESVGEREIDEAFEKIVFKSHRNEGLDKNLKEQKLCAIHEAGHAIVSELLCDVPVESVNIIGTLNGAGGYTMTNQDEEKGIYTKEDLNDRIMILYAGAAAEEIIFNQKSTGSSNDFEKATALIKDMCFKYGLYNHQLVVDMFGTENALYNAEVERSVDISNRLYDVVKGFLRKHQDRLEQVALALEEKESLDRNEFLEIIKEI